MRRTGKIAVILLTLFVASFLTNKVKYHYGWEDAFLRTLLSWCEDTVWAPGFSLDNFEKVRLAMSKAEVLELLGPPLTRPDGQCDEKQECFWMYSWQATQTADFDQRWVIFGEDGKVSKIKKSFFID